MFPITEATPHARTRARQSVVPERCYRVGSSVSLLRACAPLMCLIVRAVLTTSLVDRARCAR